MPETQRDRFMRLAEAWRCCQPSYHEPISGLDFEVSQRDLGRYVSECDELRDLMPRPICDLCESRECGGCGDDDSEPCDEGVAWLADNRAKLDALCVEAGFTRHSALQALVDKAVERARWMLHNGGLWCVNWPLEWRPAHDPPLLEWLSARIDSAIAAEAAKVKP